MPTYEYSCKKCGKEFEVFQSMKDAPLTVCTCGKKGKVFRKIGSGAGLIFKGSGFYITDYKKKSGGGSSSSGGDSGGSKSESSKASSGDKASSSAPSSSASSASSSSASGGSGASSSKSSGSKS